MTTSPPPQGENAGADLADQFREMGKNLSELLRTAWESDERKKIQREVELGLADLGDAVKKVGQEMSQSPAGEKLKANMNDIRQRVESGEVENKLRAELLKALQTINEGLRKAAEKGKSEEENPSNS